ncbi:hypothetical protein E2C01_056979 [Portunus trituberculatus]|uniref:Uncharacterized protein n=1 Tax=Portunus trituberculatus TaxID=210409 RepID=A0A5B7GZ55_PORTR|nr:hypothetical protein [Portunus trituberculatus]
MVMDLMGPLLLFSKILCLLASNLSFLLEGCLHSACF